MPSIKKSLESMLAIAKDNTHGYSQDKRYGPDYDCSSLIAKALRDGGFNVKPTSYTGNLYDQLKECGFKELSVNDTRKPGDIFLTPGHHVVMCVDGDTIVHASINENGKTTGGKTGDQTGREICTRKFYTPSYGWKYHLRYNEPETKEEKYKIPQILIDVADGKYGNGAVRKKKLEAEGYDYETIRKLVNTMLGD